MVNLHSLISNIKNALSRFVLVLRRSLSSATYSVSFHDRQRVAYGALSGVYIATALILVLEGAVALALCAFAASLVYAFMWVAH
jgi:hypothetical protein